MSFLFAFIFELIFSFIFEGSYELSKERSLPKWLRIVLLGVFIISTSALVLGFMFFGIVLFLKGDLASGVIFTIVSLVMFFGITISFYKEYKARSNKMDTIFPSTYGDNI